MTSNTPSPAATDSVAPKKGMRGWPRYFALAVLAWIIVVFRVVRERIADSGFPPWAGKETANTKDRVKPEIQRTEFGSITIGGTVYRHDVLIRLDGRVEKRKKKLSKQDTGTSHLVSLDEARNIYQEGAVRLIVGTGQSGMVKLSEEAADYFKRKGCSVELLPTPAAIGVWNEAKGAVIGLFHVTC